MGWEGHVAYKGERRIAYSILAGKSDRSRRKEDYGVGRRLIMKRFFQQLD
jgi:hypothetical protein